MRCADVIHELAAPTGAIERTLLSEHLDRCPSCARWAARSARLDQIWEATRPPELSASAWDRIWANVSESLDRPRVAAPASAVPVVAPLWRRSAVAVFVLAQAAAILIGLGLAWHQAPTSTPAPVAPAQVAVAEVEVEDFVFNLPTTGTSVISFDDKTLRNLALNGNPNEVDPLFNGFNDLESQAGLQ